MASASKNCLKSERFMQDLNTNVLSHYKVFLPFQFDCSQLGLVPDVIFGIGEKNFNISAEYHVQQNVSDDCLSSLELLYAYCNNQCCHSSCFSVLITEKRCHLARVILYRPGFACNHSCFYDVVGVQ